MSSERSKWDSSTTDWRNLKPLAREMRKEPTAGERILWQKVRNRAIQNAKFRRQHAIGPFIVDFACLEHWLVIEIDGDSHATKEDYDRYRQQQIESAGYRVLRFHDEEVIRNLHSVLVAIYQALEPTPQG